MRKRRLTIALAVVTLLLAVLACNPPGRRTPEVPTNTPPGIGDVTTTPPTLTTAPEGPTDTPPPDVPGPEGCTLNSAFVADVSIPDNTRVSPGESFRKTWRVRNTGTCDWEADTRLAFSSGDRMDGPDNVAVGAVDAGDTVEITVDLTAPSSPGTYKGNWQLEDPEGTRFGSIIYVQVVVPEPVTDTPTPTKTPTASPSPTSTEDVCVDVHPDLERILDHAEDMGYDIGCPTEEAFETWGAIQQFWANVDHVNPHMHFRSLMIWRQDNREIYVIDGTDTDASEGILLAYTDTWEEGQPEVPPACAGMTVPDGYQLPIRGFGKIWCSEDLVDLIGWPAAPEEGTTMLVQPTETGLLMRIPAHTMRYLVALDYRGVYGLTLFILP
ncbi:MAG: NBR1-Ig-like domain-containing protein [Anaerolineae bacterium]